MVNIGFFVEGLDLGGSETQLYLLLKNIDRKKISPVVFCKRLGEVAESIESLGISIHCVPMKATYHPLTPFYLAKFWTLVRKHQIKLVHLFFSWHQLLETLTARMAGARVVSSRRDLYTYWPQRHFIINRMANYFTDAIIVNSLKVKEFIVEKERIPQGKATVVYNGIEFRNQRFKGHPFKNKRGKVRIGILARLEKQKQITHFIDALILLAEKRRVEGIIGGEGAEKEELLRYVSMRGAEKLFSFVGKVRDRSAFFKGLDMFVLSSQHEGLPNVVLESFLHDVPVVAYDVGGVSEIFPSGHEWFWVQEKTPEALAQKVETVIANARMVAKLLPRVREFVLKKFDARLMATNTMAVYDEVLNNHES